MASSWTPYRVCLTRIGEQLQKARQHFIILPSYLQDEAFFKTYFCLIRACECDTSAGPEHQSSSLFFGVTESHHILSTLEASSPPSQKIVAFGPQPTSLSLLRQNDSAIRSWPVFVVGFVFEGSSTTESTMDVCSRRHLGYVPASR